MWSYDINIMGPVSSWYEREKIPYKILEDTIDKSKQLKLYEEMWCGGRIDCYCSDVTDKNYDKYGVELELPIMKEDSYIKFTEWLDSFTSKELLEFEIIKDTYEKETGKVLDLYDNVKR